MLNYMTVVAKTADIGNVYYDGAQLTSLPAFSSSYVIGEFTAVGGAIAHGSHSVTARAGTTSKFAAYVYGHGTSTTTRSSYGFTTTYEGAQLIQLSPIIQPHSKITIHLK